MKYTIIFLFLMKCFLFFGQEKANDMVKYVNPFIGTQRMGHTFPGACVPFGMVQLSPDTDTISYDYQGKYNSMVYKYCAGYQYDDQTIVGFSHTHFSGTGHSDLGDILIIPTVGELKLNPGTADDPESGYRSNFSHEDEFAEPNYYQVKLKDYNINAELTTSTRVGFHKYTFPESDEAHVILDMIHGIYNYDNKNVWTFIRIENDTLVTGYRQTTGWARTRTVYFAIAFNKSFKSYGHQKLDDVIYHGFYRKFNEKENFPEMAGRKIRAYFNFDTKEDEEIMVKVALSPTSIKGAINNLQTEIPNWDFEKVKNDGQKQWNDELSKIQVETITSDEKVIFYTALYHCFLSPIVYMDVHGKYKGLDQNIHQAEGFTNYTIFSLWDTYRALHPLFNLIQPERNSDMVESMLAHYEQSVHPMLPVWSHYANENWCMIGYHSVSVIADAIVKNVYDGNIEKVLEACLNTARYPKYDGLIDYMNIGYVPDDKNPYSVSNTLEYAYDDWTIAQIAKIAGNQDIYEEFINRSQNYRNVFNKESGFMQPRVSDGTFREQFDPLDTHGQGFIEGNAFNYGLYVPHDIEELVGLMGGKEKFEMFLDSLYSNQLDDKHIEKNEDITREGIIGLYVHGNEPGHHIPYLYNWTDHPEKTQERVRMILNAMYKNENNGLCGNDDCGQMSAWYVFSALGFYPVCPGSNEYAIGSPLIKNAKIHLKNGKLLKIKVQNQQKDNVLVKQVFLNGKEIKDFKLTHDQIERDGELLFILD